MHICNSSKASAKRNCRNSLTQASIRSIHMLRIECPHDIYGHCYLVTNLRSLGMDYGNRKEIYHYKKYELHYL